MENVGYHGSQKSHKVSFLPNNWSNLCSFGAVAISYRTTWCLMELVLTLSRLVLLEGQNFPGLVQNSVGFVRKLLRKRLLKAKRISIKFNKKGRRRKHKAQSWLTASYRWTNSIMLRWGSGTSKWKKHEKQEYRKYEIIEVQDNGNWSGEFI